MCHSWLGSNGWSAAALYSPGPQKPRVDKAFFKPGVITMGHGQPGEAMLAFELTKGNCQSGEGHGWPCGHQGEIHVGVGQLAYVFTESLDVVTFWGPVWPIGVIN